MSPFEFWESVEGRRDQTRLVGLPHQDKRAWALVEKVHFFASDPGVIRVAATLS